VAPAINISAVLALLKHEMPRRRVINEKKVHKTRGRVLEIACITMIGTGRSATRIQAIAMRVAKLRADSEKM
jgi:hypothetical protein